MGFGSTTIPLCLGDLGPDCQDAGSAPWDLGWQGPAESGGLADRLLQLGFTDEQGQASARGQQPGRDREDLGEALHCSQGNYLGLACGKVFCADR